MSLYTKYRPQNFDEVVGQESAIKYFKNIIEKNRNGEDIPHAYLLSGGHGIGKTTIARIFARALGSSEADIYELDAASSSKKIDDMREIIDSAYTMPINSKYKIYIFDEAHMLTKDSSNAFLKILEEPPTHVIFILCTTDPGKLISTVRSRCNIIKLEKPSPETIKDRLISILNKENINLKDDEVINIISRNSNRSFRDSITNLEKVLHTCGDNASREEVENIFGHDEASLYIKLFSNFIFEKKESGQQDKEKKIEDLLSFLSKSYQDISYSKMLDYIRAGMMIRQNVEVDEEYQEGEFVGFVKSSPSFFTSANLLYFLEKYDLYKNISDKENVLVAICGNFIEK